MRNVKYDFSSVHINVPDPFSSEIIEWGKTKITDEEIYVTQKDPTYGREDDIHITILYGILTSQPDLVQSLLAEQTSFSVRLGKINIFTTPKKFDVVMIEAFSEELNQINEILNQNVKNTNRYPKYIPHITISYVKKGKCWRYLGLSKWEGRKFHCDNVIFSSSNGIKTTINF